MRRQEGFTLIEVLVVVAIMVVLIATLLPALNKARKQSKLVQCQNNLRQMGMCMMTYCHENNGLLMDNWWWLYDTDAHVWPASYVDRQRMPYYVNNNVSGRLKRDTWSRIGRCPDTAATDPTIDVHASVGYGINDYCYSRFDGSAMVSRPLRLSGVDGASEKIMFADATTRASDGQGMRVLNTSNRTVYIGDYMDSGRHMAQPAFLGQYDKMQGRTANAVFLDGHAEFLPQAVFNNWGDYRGGNCLRYVVIP